MARTIINGVSNNARAETIQANSDVIDGVRFVGTLDGKTCPYCAAYDGYIWRGEDMASARRPPIHPICRCTLVPVVELKDADGNPIELVDEEGKSVEERPAANADFDQLAKDAYNAQAKAKGWNRRWDDLAASTRLKYYYQAQKDYEAKTGKPAYRQVPSSMTFKEYFDKQDDAFKKAWLGAKAFEEYKSGDLSEATREKLLFKPNLSYQIKPETLIGWQKGYDETEAALIEELAKATEKVEELKAEQLEKEEKELEEKAANDPVYTFEEYVWKADAGDLGFKYAFTYGDETKLDAILADASWSVFEWLEKNFQAVQDFEDVIVKKKPLESDYFSKENYEKAVSAWEDEKKRYNAFKNAFIDNLHAARNAREDAERKAIKGASAPLSVQFEGYGSWSQGATPEWLNGLTIEQLNALKALVPSAFETLNDDHGQAEPKSEDFFAPKNYETAQKQWNNAGKKITSFRTDVENAINARIRGLEEKATSDAAAKKDKGKQLDAESGTAIKMAFPSDLVMWTAIAGKDSYTFTYGQKGTLAAIVKNFDRPLLQWIDANLEGRRERALKLYAKKPPKKSKTKNASEIEKLYNEYLAKETAVNDYFDELKQAIKVATTGTVPKEKPPVKREAEPVEKTEKKEKPPVEKTDATKKRSEESKERAKSKAKGKSNERRAETATENGFRIEPLDEKPYAFPDVKDAEALKKIKVVGELGGSTGAQLVEIDGVQYVMKRGNSAGHVRNECSADAFYRSCGIRVPQFKLYETKDGPVKLSQYIPDAQPLKTWWQNATQAQKDEMSKQLRKGLAVDVLLGNWDVVGSDADNIMVDKDGNAWRIDNGGALSYRAQGAKKDAKDWGKDSFIDELWTMTGNSERIGFKDESNVPDYFGETDVLEVATSMMKYRNTPEFKAALAALGKESPDDLKAIEKRLEETRQLAERGMRYIVIEDEKTFPRETALAVLDQTYIMTKDGLRDVLRGCESPQDNNGYSEDNSGWWSRNGMDGYGEVVTKTLKNPNYGKKKNEKKTKEYRSIGDYLSDFMGAEGYDLCQLANCEQGIDSYSRLPIWRKMCILRNLGYDCTDKEKYPDAETFFKDVEKTGYYCGEEAKKHRLWKEKDRPEEIRDRFVSVFNDARADKSLFEERAKTFLKYDAAMQMILEYDKVVGADKETGTITLYRSENANILNTGGDTPPCVTKHRTGACESHSHMGKVFIYADADIAETVVRTPFSRVHTLWFLERNVTTKKLYLEDYRELYKIKSEEDWEDWKKDNIDWIKSSFIGLADSNCNEIDADTHGLPILLLPDNEDAYWGEEIEGDREVFKKWEKDHPKGTILEKSKQWRFK